MAPPVPRPPRRGLTVLAVASTLLVVVALASMAARGRPLEVFYARWLFHNAPSAVVLLWLGHALIRRQPRHGLATLFLVLGVVSALHVASISVADARLVAAGVGTQPDVEFVPAALPLDASVPFWFSAWLWLHPGGLRRHPAAAALPRRTPALAEVAAARGHRRCWHRPVDGRVHDLRVARSTG
jgi:hypothetical protein